MSRPDTELIIARKMLCTNASTYSISQEVHKSTTAIRYITHKVCWGADKALYEAGIINKSYNHKIVNSKPSMQYLRDNFADIVANIAESKSDGFYNKRRPLLTNLIYLYRVSSCGNHVISLGQMVRNPLNLRAARIKMRRLSNQGIEAFYTVGKPMAGALNEPLRKRTA